MNPPPLPVRKRFPWIIYWITLVLIILVALAPMGSVVACGLIASANGCKVDEGSVHPCIIKRTGLWTASLYSRRIRLVNACDSSRWSIRVHHLVDHSDPPSRGLAKAGRRRINTQLIYEGSDDGFSHEAFAAHVGVSGHEHGRADALFVG